MDEPGAFLVGDEIGGAEIAQALDREAPDTLTGMVDRGDLGRKSGKGFYEWVDGKAVKPAGHPVTDHPGITDRLILTLVNEAVACLAERVVRDADLLDAGVIFGTGFAPFRGGPINYARERGFEAVVDRLQELAETHGERFKPHPGWSAL